MKPKEFPENIIIITDTSCLIILNKIGSLHFLNVLFSKVITTPEIIKEYGADLPDWIKIISPTNKKFQEDLSGFVDYGEASAIALAKEIKIDFLVTDDMQARKLAVKLNLPLIGTLGVLLLAKKHGLINLIRPYLDMIKNTNFRMATDLYETVLKEADEL